MFLCSENKPYETKTWGLFHQGTTAYLKRVKKMWEFFNLFLYDGISQNGTPDLGLLARPKMRQVEPISCVGLGTQGSELYWWYPVPQNCDLYHTCDQHSSSRMLKVEPWAQDPRLEVKFYFSINVFFIEEYCYSIGDRCSSK